MYNFLRKYGLERRIKQILVRFVDSKGQKISALLTLIFCFLWNSILMYENLLPSNAFRLNLAHKTHACKKLGKVTLKALHE